jgi:hypothetical protein
MNLEYSIRPRAVALVLGIISLYLAVQSIFGEYINTVVLHGQYNSVPALILDEFSVNAEQTIPTWYQVLLLFAASVLLALITYAKRAGKDHYSRYWAALAIIFLYLSMDESAAIHEIFSDPLHNALNTSGYLAFGWQVAAVPLVIIVGLLFLRFLLSLPPRTRNLFILAGGMYITGAVVVDAISAKSLPPGGELTLQYLAIGTIEELLEMMGQVTFIYALLSTLAEMQHGFLFRSQFAPQTVPMPRVLSFARPILFTLVIIAALNLGLVYWAVTQGTSALSPVTNPVPVYQAIIEGFPTDQILVTHLHGVFGSDDVAALNYAASLLSQFDMVMVVTVPSAQSITFIAGDILPFDRQSLSEFLLSKGEIEFVIFDTSAVRTLAG